MSADDPGADILATLLADSEQERADERAERKELIEKLDALTAKVDALAAVENSEGDDEKLDALIAEVKALRVAAQSVVPSGTTRSVKIGKRTISLTVTARDAQERIESANIEVR